MSAPSREELETRLHQCLVGLTDFLDVALESINRRMQQAVSVHLRNKPGDEVRSCWAELGCVAEDVGASIGRPNVGDSVGGPASSHAQAGVSGVDELISVLRQLMPENPRSRRFTRWEIAVRLTARAE